MNKRRIVLVSRVLSVACLLSPTGVAQNSTTSFYSGVIPESAPRYWLESITHPDQSSSRLLVFQTIPGVIYRVESSTDLNTWTEIGSYTGGGQQVLVPMVQIKAPPTPTPPPANPPPPVIHTWVMLQKATEGGIVLYWHSMYPGPDERIHYSYQSHHFPNLTLDPAWEEYFIYVRKFENFAFSISHPRSLSIAPPDTSHSPEDLAMLAAFEENYDTMDGEVRDHIAAVRYIPPPAPPADNLGRGFFRIWADWTADSDGDMVPDWEEFAMMAGVAGVGAEGAFAITDTPSILAAPFDGDANTNGVLDGEELDFDDDGIPRSTDADPKDGVIAWTKTRPTRYALFDVPLGTHPNGDPIWPIGVNSQGMVLFEDGVDYGDGFHQLPSTGTNWTRAHAINDAGLIVGHALFVQGENELSALAVWPSPNDQPGMVGDGGFIGSPTYAMSYGVLNFGSAFGKDGSFVAETYELVQDQNGSHYELRYPEVWTRGPTGTFTHGQANTLSRFCKAEDIHWGWRMDDHQILTAPSGGGDLGLTGFDKYNLVGGVEPALTGGYTSSLFHTKNTWRPSPTLGNVIDISDSGIAHVAKAPAAEKIPDGLGFWMNGRFLHLRTMVPDLPQTYQDWPKVSIPGMADKGTIVLKMNSGHPLDPSACAVGFPCAVEDHVSDAVRLAYRDSDTDTVPFTGVDDISITADKPDAAAENKIWIMAPIGGEAAGNDLKVHIPVSANNPLTLGATNMDGEKTITADGGQISVKGSGNATADANLTQKLGTSTALNAPIGIKAMKRRNVNVTVTPVAGVYKKAYPAGTEETAPNPPDYMPGKERLEKYLNKVFELQLNAKIDLTIKPMVTLDFSTMGEESFIPNSLSEPPTHHDRYLETSLTMDTVEQLAFLPLRDPGADINVYVFGGLGIRHWYFHPLIKRYDYLFAAGLASVANREAWVDGDFTGLDAIGFEAGEGIYKHVMQTIAHEMGHIIIKSGHPDQDAGAAPLPGTNHLERLMVSGGGPARGKKLGTRIVKGEWDAAEEWLQKREEDSNQND